jgi:hypothetical protein
MIPHALDPNQLDEVGWAIIFPGRSDPAIYRSLEPLLELRQRQASQRSERSFRVFSGELGYRRGETKSTFLSRFGVSPGEVQPDALPYYLLLVGSPQEIPYTFQQHLGVQYAVGRIHLEGPEAYHTYARAVVESETKSTIEQPPAVAVFAPTFPNDPYTAQLRVSLVEPLLALLQDRGRCDAALNEDATKGRLLAFLAREDGPPLLFVATHAVLAAEGNVLRWSMHGAPLCIGWPGPGSGQPVDHGSVLTAADLSTLLTAPGSGFKPRGSHGRVVVLWFSFSAGVHVSAASRRRRTVGPSDGVSTVSPLAHQLLTNESSGTLAFIGLIDRLWGHSFAASGTLTRDVLLRTLSGLLLGDRVGHAAQACTEAYAQASTILVDALERLRLGNTFEPAQLKDLGALWATTEDLRNLVVLGDPAVRLPGVRRPELA